MSVTVRVQFQQIPAAQSPGPPAGIRFQQIPAAQSPGSRSWQLLRAFARVGFASILFACPAAPSEAPTAATHELESKLPDTCGTPQHFTDYEWVPDDARLVTSIRRDADDLADALTVIARMAEAPDSQLPVFAALDFRNLALQLGNLDRLLDELGLEPSELVELHSPAGDLVWLWPSDCPPASLAARLLDRWQVMLRADLERFGLRRGSGSTEGFPFDVLTLGDERVALTLFGRGAKVSVWLHEAPRGGDEGPGRALAEIPAAPIRTVLSDQSLLTSPAQAAQASPSHRRFRVTNTAWSEHES